MKRFNLKDHPVIAGAVSVVTLLTAVGGGIWTLGDKPPWASVERVAQIEQANMRTRYSQVLADIARLQSKGRLTIDEKRWLDSLLIEQQQLCMALKLPKC